MELINQHTKAIMEGCKERARAAGLRFEDETLEYIVTNRDLLELTPKLMIPTLYDYWVHDVEVLKEKGRYELYPGNPYETVINTRPAISFYNDNNPDWLNVMIFYHVLAHIDFFQNNIFFRHTWDFDLTGQALSDKRLVARLRARHGRWVDYVIEFARGIDNLVGYFEELARYDRPAATPASRRFDYYFDVFLQDVKKVRTSDYIREVERYNACCKDQGELGIEGFFAEVVVKYPEFEALYEKSLGQKGARTTDLLQYLMEHSEFLKREDNRWMLSVLQVVRNTSVYFQPQIRTKILNEGWASYWHERLFLEDDRIQGHEVDFARVHAGVTSLPKVGLNPYALGMRLFEYIEEMADKGRYSFAYQKLGDAEERRRFDAKTGKGRETIFAVRANESDFSFISRYIDQDFLDRHKLFVAGKRLNRARMTWQYYIKSRKAADYRQMLVDDLYHPPRINVARDRGEDGSLYLVHKFEGKPLVRDYIANTLLGIEYLWGRPVQLETSEPVPAAAASSNAALAGAFSGVSAEREGEPAHISWRRVLYTLKNRELSKVPLS
ncbi:SpoVR family protein [Geoalkalibacter sp.]|uniref:SpoVR family protein n=1 Tax=Geoalkalibacter sp. TaxID=3041440 RepID=UPI00272DFE70|nr:SpoVR family protein [Geoalkalibacter sp.]